MMMKWLYDDVIIDFPVFDESVTRGPTDRQTDRPTDGRTDKPGYRDARTHLKRKKERKEKKKQGPEAKNASMS